MKILLVEDHLPTAQSVHWLLSSQYRVTHAASCHEAFNKVGDQQFDMMIVDLHLPDQSGLELCQFYRDEPDSARILILSGKSDLQTKLTAFQEGADDFVSKPFDSRELYARVKALLRRPKQKFSHYYHFYDLNISLSGHFIEKNGQRTSLTPIECNLLKKLLRNRGQLVAREALCDAAEVNIEHREILDTHIKNLRHKLGLLRQNSTLETIYGEGYRLNIEYAKH